MSVYKNDLYPRRGEIYYVKKGNTVSTGAEMWSDRHAVIVSSNHINKYSNAVLVVYITTRNKAPSSFHVDISTRKKRRIALCEQITTVDKSRIVEYKGCLSSAKMRKIDEALMWTIGLHKYFSKKIDKTMSDMV